VDDPQYFAETFWRIKHPAHGIIPFKLFDAQIEGLEHWQENRYSLTLKARQIGWSTLASMYVFWFAALHPGREVLLISRTEREARDLLKKVRTGYNNLPDWFQQRIGSQPTLNQERMEFDNGSVIASLPSASDPARGSSAALIVVDEWAFLPNPDDAWASIEPVADVGGRIIGLSTANGSGNFFHRTWVGARSGTNPFKALFKPWNARDDRDEEWYAAKQRALLPWQLAQEYPSNEDEAFVKSGRNVFDVEDLVIKVKCEPPVRGWFSANGNLIRSFEFKAMLESKRTPAEGAPLRIWKFPEQGHVYVMGADASEGLQHGDYSAAHVIDVNTGEVVAVWHGHTQPDLFGKELMRLGFWYNTAIAGPEANNHGATVVATMRRLEYPKMFRWRQLETNNKSGRPTSRFGFWTSRSTKPQIIDDLAAALRDGTVILRDEETLAELRTFVRDDAGRMNGSPFDDRVMSLAITNHLRGFAYLPEYREQHDDYMTFDWWARQGKDENHSQWQIGAHSTRKKDTYGWR
jgi:hypothetical protein